MGRISTVIIALVALAEVSPIRSFYFAPAVFANCRQSTRYHAESSLSLNADGSPGPTSTSSSSARSSGSSDGDPTTDTATTNLYDILGANPSDSHAELRRKYTALARLKHPDAGTTKADASSFSEIAAAWAVLGDAKERLRYDRSLKANEFTENVASLLEVGIRNAVPFLQKTANTTMAAVETSSKTMQDVSEQLERTRYRLALEQKRRDLQQHAARESSRAAQLEAERKAIVSGDASARLAELSRSESKLSAVQALRILGKLGDLSSSGKAKETKAKSKLSDDIAILDSLEQRNGQQKTTQQEKERALQAAVRQQEDATQRENSAQQKLEEAKRELETARKNLATAKQDEAKTSQEAKKAIIDADSAQNALEQHQEVVRSKLRRKEEQVLKKKAQELKAEVSRAMKFANGLESEAVEVAKAVDAAIRQENEREKS